jgi:membrane-bound serine protease (ClpP class)
MLSLGIALLVVGAVLAVAEAHVPSGALGTGALVALIAGAAITLTAAGGGLALALPAAIGAGAVGAGYLLLATRKVAAARHALVRGGSEELVGRLAEVRSWDDRGSGQVFADGALWQARLSLADEGDRQPQPGDKVVIERVSGLTLAVRTAEEWEVT